MGLFWPHGRSRAVVPGMGLLGSTEQSILSQSYVWGGSWRDKTSSEGLGSSILVKEGDEPESFLRAALP